MTVHYKSWTRNLFKLNIIYNVGIQLFQNSQKYLAKHIWFILIPTHLFGYEIKVFFISLLSKNSIWDLRGLKLLAQWSIFYRSNK